MTSWNTTSFSRCSMLTLISQLRNYLTVRAETANTWPEQRFLRLGDGNREGYWGESTGNNMNRPTGKAQMDRYFIGGETAISSKNLYPRYRVYEAGISGTRMNNKQYISTIGKGKYIYRVSRWECARLRQNVPYVKVHRSNPTHLYPKLNGYGDNGERKVWSSCGSTYCTC